MSRKTQERRHRLLIRSEQERQMLRQNLLAFSAPLHLVDQGVDALRVIARHPVLTGISGFLFVRLLPRTLRELAVTFLGARLRRWLAT